MASIFINVIQKQMRKGKDHIFDYNDPEALKKFRDMLLKMFSIMKKTRSVEIEKLQIGNIPAEKHTLKNLKVFEPLIMLHLHGGGYFSGSAKMYRAFVSHLCKKLQVHAYSISYRLVPEHPYPAAINDAFYTYKWLLEEKSIPAERIIILGDSAGGGLALALLHRIGKNRMPQPKCAISISPWTDLTLSNDSYVANRKNDAFFNFKNLEEGARL
jgi:acetyl esterase/lipase